MKTQRQVAKDIGMSPGYLSKLVNGRVAISGPEQLKELADGFGLTIGEFYVIFPMAHQHDPKSCEVMIDIQMIAPALGARTQTDNLGNLMNHLTAIERMTGIRITMTVKT